MKCRKSIVCKERKKEEESGCTLHSSCGLMWTAKYDLACVFETFVRHAPAPLLCRTLLVSFNCLYEAHTDVLDGGILWYVVLKRLLWVCVFSRFDEPLHALCLCCFLATELMSHIGYMRWITIKSMVIAFFRLWLPEFLSHIMHKQYVLCLFMWLDWLDKV